MDITTTIGAYNADTKQVEVTFAMNGVTHVRGVNAVLTAAGKYSKAATAERVAEVERGVAIKIAAGVITNPPPMEELPVDDATTDTPKTV